LIAQTRGGISAQQLRQETRVTYKTAGRSCWEVSEMLAEDYDPFTGDFGFTTLITFARREW
jgi:hypothetical protein